MVDRQKRKRMLIRFRQIIVIVILLYVGLVFFWDFLIVKSYPAGDGGVWVEVSGAERSVYYNVSQSGDDAMIHVEHGAFTSTTEVIPFQMSGYQIMGGLVYSIPDRVFNETHREHVIDAWLEFYSDDQTTIPSGTISFYQINQSTIGPFTSYADLANAPAPYHMGTIPLFTLGRGANPDGWEGWRDASLRWLETGIDRVGDYDYFPELDNNSFGLRYVSSPGNLEYFHTYDKNVSEAPRIFVEWGLYQWVNATPPPGDATYVDEYEDFHIWEIDDTDGWFNFSTFSVSGADSGKIQNLNDTYYLANAIHQDSDVFLNRTFDDDGTGIINRKWGMTFTGLPWVGPGVWGYAGIWAISNPPMTRSDAMNEAYVFASRTNATAVYGNMWSITGNALTDAESCFQEEEEAGLPWTWWFDMDLNMNTRTGQVRIYNDMAMTSLNHTRNPDFVLGGPVYSQGLFVHEYMTHQFIAPPEPNTGYTAEFHSEPSSIQVQYSATDWNGTNLSDLYDSIDEFYDSLDDLEDAIDRLYTGLDPSYDTQPELGNTLILLMGVMGMIMIPGSFLLLGHSIKEGDWVTGFYYLLVFFFVGLGFVTVWLFG